jgi:hypothetical protein
MLEPRGGPCPPIPGRFIFPRSLFREVLRGGNSGLQRVDKKGSAGLSCTIFVGWPGWVGSVLICGVECAFQFSVGSICSSLSSVGSFLRLSLLIACVS